MKIPGIKLLPIFNLPLIICLKPKPELGRANKYAAQAYLAKLRLYQAYEQDANHKVTSINQARLQEVVTLTQAVISSGKYSLSTDIANNFLPETENGPESVFAIQFTINDGTTAGRLSYEDGLNYPHGAPQYGCCGFHAAKSEPGKCTYYRCKWIAQFYNV